MVVRTDPPDPDDDLLEVSLTLDCSYATVKDRLEETCADLKTKERYQFGLHHRLDVDRKHLFEIRDPGSPVLATVKVIESKPGEATEVVIDNRDPGGRSGRKALKRVVIAIVRVFSQKFAPRYVTQREQAQLMMDLRPYWPP